MREEGGEGVRGQTSEGRWLSTRIVDFVGCPDMRHEMASRFLCLLTQDIGKPEPLAVVANARDDAADKPLNPKSEVDRRHSAPSFGAQGLPALGAASLDAARIGTVNPSAPKHGTDCLALNFGIRVERRDILSLTAFGRVGIRPARTPRSPEGGQRQGQVWPGNRHRPAGFARPRRIP